MTNTSATGGPLVPSGSYPPPLQGRALNDFLNGWLAPIAGLAGNLVRPGRQTEPPNIPAAATAWMAFVTTSRRTDAFPAVVHDGAANGGLGEDRLQRHEELDVLCSVYDTGTNSRAEEIAAQLRDGVVIAQNREKLFLAGMGLIAATETLAVPSLLKVRWLYRVDLTISLRRVIVRAYPVENVRQAVGVIHSNPTADNSTGDTPFASPLPPGA